VREQLQREEGRDPRAQRVPRDDELQGGLQSGGEGVPAGHAYAPRRGAPAAAAPIG